MIIMWKNIIFKVGQVFGIGACIFIAFALLTGIGYEPRWYIFWPEVIGSIIAALLLAADVLDLMPEFD